jgi:hypothetical protein
VKRKAVKNMDKKYLCEKDDSISCADCPNYWSCDKNNLLKEGGEEH